MNVIDSLEKIRPAWLIAIANRLARGVEVRRTLEQELGLFYDQLLQAVITGDPHWLDLILADWAPARTQSELEQSASSLPPILAEMLLSMYEVCDQSLDSTDGLAVVGAILPVFTYAFEFTSKKETELKIESVSRELQETKTALERLDKSKSDFIAIAAHELKTPLTLIEGYMSMLRERMPEQDQESMAIILMKGMDNGTRRLKEIIDDMIDISMIDNNLLSLNFQPIWMNRIVDVVVHEYEPIVHERDQTVVVNSFPGYDEMFYGDSERLYQAFRNLYSNAIKFTPDGGKIIIGGRKLPGFLEITLEDTGIGIDPENQLAIFEKFGRIGNVSLHSSGKTKYKGGGPGLGLPITKGIIEAHGGAIWVESEAYDEVNCPGSVFHVLIPLRKEASDERIAKLFEGLNAQPG